jgi:glycosyltransferase involved in cell wall biosynthesis
MGGVGFPGTLKFEAWSFAWPAQFEVLPPPPKPSVASYVSDFLKPDMLHVYRQITGLQAMTPWVLTHKREHAGQFPFPQKHLIVLPRPRLRAWRRFVARQIRHAPWQIYRWELRRMLLELTRTDAKVLHIYFGHIAVHLLPLIKIWPHPVVVSFHGADAGVGVKQPHHLAALREVFQQAALIQARSDSLLDDLAALGCPRSKLHLQRTGIPLEEWTFAPREVPPAGDWTLLQSCRFIGKKGVDLTLRAFADIAREFPSAKLVIAGDGPLRPELEKLTADLGLAPRVRFPGFLNQRELRGEVRGAHLFFHPSRTTEDGNREGIPNSMLEAMASGAAVIATNHGGIPEAVTDGESGLLVAEDDAPALAGAALRIMKNPDLLRHLSAGGRRTVEQRFDRWNNLRGLEECYLKLRGARPT